MGILRHFTKELVDGVEEDLFTLQSREITHTRSGRRASEQRAKQKVVRKEKQYSKYPRLDPATVGKEASCHSRRCSCWMCGSPRKGKGKERLTLQERRNEYSD